MTAPQINFVVKKRVPFDTVIAEMGVDYSGATLTCDVRALPGDQGSAVISLSGASPPAQGLSVVYDPNYPDPDGVLPNGASLIRIIISETTLEGVGYNAETSNSVALYYDIHMTPSGASKFVFCEGKLILEPGVTL